MFRHRALLLTVGTTFVALLCCSAFAQHPASPQNQSASPSQFTVNVSKGTVVAPPVNSAWPPLPPDVSDCLKRATLDLIGVVGEGKAIENTENYVANPVLSVLGIGEGVVVQDPLHVEWASIDATGAYIPGVGSAYGVVSDLSRSEGEMEFISTRY